LAVRQAIEIAKSMRGVQFAAQAGPGSQQKSEDVMKRVLLVSLLAVIWSFGTAQGQQPKGKKAIYVSAEDANYKDSVPGVQMATLWGDPDKGAHGTYTKFAPGFDAGMHSHTHSVWISVVKGAYLYKDEDGEKRVGPGAFIWVPGGKKHWSGGDKTEGALFYEESDGKFDNLPAK
jgi:quercetin dioxygenase-like cupin family protein